MALTPDQQAAVTRLGQYNGARWDAISNTYGFAGTGYKTNFPQACNDTATATQAMSGLADIVVAANVVANTNTVIAKAQQVADNLALVQQLTPQLGTAANVLYPALNVRLPSAWSGAGAPTAYGATDIVDVFVYDTRLDDRLPDGSRWTDRCANLSWYQETLATATRGSKAAFPTVALIVAHQTKLVIYDALDLDASGFPKMWMVFSSTAWKWGNTARSITAKNGCIYVATNGSLEVLNFPADDMQGYNPTGKFGRGSIAARNVAATTYARAPSGIGIVGNDAQGVDVRVLPGALRDDFGLPIPTIAVATPSGASVIRDSGTVWDITRSGGFSKVAFLSDSRLAITATAASAVRMGPIPTADMADTVWSGVTYNGFSTIPAHGGGGAGTPTAVAPGAVGLTNGLTLLSEDTTTPANGMVAYLTSRYATGWLPGDIRGAYLCDGDVGTIAGAELVTNGAFATDVSGWTPRASAGVTWASGAMRVASTGTTGQGVTQSIPTVVGQTYVLMFDAVGGTTNYYYADVTDATQVTVLAPAVTAASSTASGVRMQFMATTSQSVIRLFTNSTNGQYVDYDNVTCRACSADRSYKAKGIGIYGTLTRSLLSSASDLVWWSGWSANDYAQQPYNAELDTGTGEVLFGIWVYTTWTANQFIASRYTPTGTGTGAGWTLFTNNAGTQFSITDGTNTASAISTTLINDGRPHFVQGMRRASTATVELGIDGVVVASASAASVGSLTNTSAVLRLGSRMDGAQPFGGGLALPRIGATAPTLAQIGLMYRTERARVDGKGLLGGTSDAVSDLDYDEATGTYTVSTGDGVSRIVGLNRVGYADARGLGVGAEIATGGDFSSNSTAGWTAVNSTLSASGGEMQIFNSLSSGWGTASRNYAVTAGKTYLVTMRGRAAGFPAYVSVLDSLASGSPSLGNGSNGSTVTQDVYVIARPTGAQLTISLQVQNGGVGSSAAFSLVSIKEIGALGSDTVRAACWRDGHLLVATDREAGVWRDAIGGLEAANRGGLTGSVAQRQTKEAIDQTALLRGWHALPIHPAALRATNGATGPELLDFGTRHCGMAYDTASAETAYFSIPMPASYDGGPVRVKLWIGTLSTVGQSAWSIAAAGGALDTALGTAVSLQATTATAGVEVATVVSGDITPSGTPAGNARLVVGVTRNVTDAFDTYASDAYVTGGLVFVKLALGADL